MLKLNWVPDLNIVYNFYRLACAGWWKEHVFPQLRTTEPAKVPSDGNRKWDSFLGLIDFSFFLLSWEYGRNKGAIFFFSTCQNKLKKPCSWFFFFFLTFQRHDCPYLSSCIKCMLNIMHFFLVGSTQIFSIFSLKKWLSTYVKMESINFMI